MVEYFNIGGQCFGVVGFECVQQVWKVGIDGVDIKCLEYCVCGEVVIYDQFFGQEGVMVQIFDDQWFFVIGFEGGDELVVEVIDIVCIGCVGLVIGVDCVEC